MANRKYTTSTVASVKIITYRATDKKNNGIRSDRSGSAHATNKDVKERKHHGLCK
ncbi:hypothetical protein MBAV_003391, partial [Candidatus Magnetobacterium bavaricum]